MLSQVADARVAVDQIVADETLSALQTAREFIGALGLDLSAMTVVVGGGHGYQAAAAAVAALAGARRVLAIRDGRRRLTRPREAASAADYIKRAGVAEKVEVVDHVSSPEWRHVDIVVSSPSICPLTRSVIELLPQRAVIALMAEPWELGSEAIDAVACDEAGIRIAAPNYNHPVLMMHGEFARLCCSMIEEAGLKFRDSAIAVISDTPLAPSLEHALRMRRSRVAVFPHPQLLSRSKWDAAVVAMRPSSRPPMNIKGLGHILEQAGRILLVQFSGEIDRSAASYFGLRVWPQKRPGRGQLGMPLDTLGPSPSIRKLVAGLKAAETAYRGSQMSQDSIGYLIEKGSLER